LELKYHLCYRQTSIGTQHYSAIIEPRSFYSEIASARTFVLKSEADLLRQQGLGLQVGYQDILVFDDATGPIENQLRFPNECARHKVLDMIGDFALLGANIVGKFTAYRSGHRHNAQMATALFNHAEIRQGDRIEPMRKFA
jgi:UDP-3-O-acyl-N-acetylglucosamine deacetylase